MLLKPEIHRGGLSLGRKILLSQGCKYTRIPAPLEKHRPSGRAKMRSAALTQHTTLRKHCPKCNTSMESRAAEGFTMSGLLLADGVGDVRVPGAGQLGVQDCLGDLQHSSLGHPHQGIGHQLGAPGTLQAGGQQGKVQCEQCCADGNRLARGKKGSRGTFWNFLCIPSRLSA